MSLETGRVVKGAVIQALWTASDQSLKHFAVLLKGSDVKGAGQTLSTT